MDAPANGPSRLADSAALRIDFSNWRWPAVLVAAAGAPAACMSSMVSSSWDMVARRSAMVRLAACSWLPSAAFSSTNARADDSSESTFSRARLRDSDAASRFFIIRTRFLSSAVGLGGSTRSAAVTSGSSSHGSSGDVRRRRLGGRDVSSALTSRPAGVRSSSPPLWVPEADSSIPAAAADRLELVDGVWRAAFFAAASGEGDTGLRGDAGGGDEEVDDEDGQFAGELPMWGNPVVAAVAAARAAMATGLAMIAATFWATEAAAAAESNCCCCWYC
ncbi:hypothetical protein BC828DRAFT_386584 [Blastocladiella britannica]|nr:hypothetical protein BC828DRAFT_386584 [Blastocladiella britannica]